DRGGWCRRALERRVHTGRKRRHRIGPLPVDLEDAGRRVAAVGRAVAVAVGQDRVRRDVDRALVDARAPGDDEVGAVGAWIADIAQPVSVSVRAAARDELAVVVVVDHAVVVVVGLAGVADEVAVGILLARVEHVLAVVDVVVDRVVVLVLAGVAGVVVIAVLLG